MKVRKRRYRSGKVAWVLDLGLIGERRANGKPKRKFLTFKTKDEADGAKANALEKQSEHGNRALSLPEEKRVRYEAAEARLAPAGVTIEQVVDHWFATARTLKPPILLGPALELCIAEKESLGIVKRSLQQFRCSCLSFIRAHPNMLSNGASRSDVQKWVLGNGWAPKTQRVYLGDLRAFFAWLVDEDLTESNPCAAEGKKKRVKLAKMVESEITAFDPDYCERLLNGALMLTEPRGKAGEQREAFVFRPLLGYIALGVFCGIRPEEAQASPRSAVDLETRTAQVTGAISKTAKTRNVDLSDNAAEWLALWLGLCPEQRGIIPKNFRRLWERLRQRLGMFKDDWPHDVLRHTFASMFFALHKSASRLKAELGHSEDEDTLERHYKAVRTIAGTVISRAMAARFWSVFPPPRYREGE